MPVGIEIMKDLVTNIALANRNAELTRSVLVDLRDGIAEQVESTKAMTEVFDDVCGHFEVFALTMKTLEDNRRGGKVSLTDFVEAYNLAAAEVYSGEEEDEDDGGELVER